MSTQQAWLPRSDALGAIRDVFEAFPALSPLGEVFQLSLIVDTNIILGELIWLTRTRRNQTARTALEEVLAAKTVRAVAPIALAREVEEKLPVISEREDIPLAALNDQWVRYRALIGFLPDPEIPEQLRAEAQDPDDLPFVLLQGTIGAFIRSDDSDIPACGGVVIGATVIARLRDYSRAAAIEFTVKLGGAVITGVTIGVLVLIWELLKAALGGFRQLPQHIQGVIGFVVLIGLLHPYSRRYLLTQFSKLGSAAAAPLAALSEAIQPLLESYVEAEKRATTLVGQIKTELPALPGRA